MIVCAVNMVITLSSDYLYVLAMLKTTPLGQFGVYLGLIEIWYNTGS